MSGRAVLVKKRYGTTGWRNHFNRYSRSGGFMI
jgi:hypothetical protein